MGEILKLSDEIISTNHLINILRIIGLNLFPKICFKKGLSASVKKWICLIMNNTTPTPSKIRLELNNNEILGNLKILKPRFTLKMLSSFNANKNSMGMIIISGIEAISILRRFFLSKPMVYPCFLIS
ncbi:MAG: hypothetical protein ACTSYF_14720, partial [Promethearchaeota archaeon]